MRQYYRLHSIMDAFVKKALNKTITIGEDSKIKQFDKYGMEIEFYCYNDLGSPYGWVIKDGEAVNWVAAEIGKSTVGFSVG